MNVHRKCIVKNTRQDMILSFVKVINEQWNEWKIVCAVDRFNEGTELSAWS